MKHETIATFPLADKAKADELRKQLVAEGRQAWLSMNTSMEVAEPALVLARLRELDKQIRSHMDLS